MFIQLTRTDGVPVWLNACFVVTVEPGRNGGSIVVPIGDGLDYEVRESPESVLAMLDGVAPVKVVPVPPPKSLTPRPDDVSPEPDSRNCDKVKGSESVPAQKKVCKNRSASKKKADVSDVGASAQALPVEKPQESVASKKKRAASKKKSDPVKPGEPVLPEEYHKIVDDLKSRKCRTVKRMRNALKSFYGKTDADEIDRIIEAMISAGNILVEADGHVNWVS